MTTELQEAIQLADKLTDRPGYSYTIKQNIEFDLNIKGKDDSFFSVTYCFASVAELITKLQQILNDREAVEHE